MSCRGRQHHPPARPGRRTRAPSWLVALGYGAEPWIFAFHPSPSAPLIPPAFPGGRPFAVVLAWVILRPENGTPAWRGEPRRLRWRLRPAYHHTVAVSWANPHAAAPRLRPVVQESIDAEHSGQGLTSRPSTSPRWRYFAGHAFEDRERRISPSLSTLDALAEALNVPITSLFADIEERRDCSFVKAGPGVRIERRGTKAGHLYDLLGHSLAGDIAVEPYLITPEARTPCPTRISVMPASSSSTCCPARFATAMPTQLSDGAGRCAVLRRRRRHGPEDLIEAPMQYLSIIIYPRDS